MKRTLVLALLTLFVSSLSWGAEAPQAGFWDNLKAKIEKVTPRKKVNANTAVGGVRSARQQDDDLYWKGKEASLEADQDELEVFKQALQKAAAGQRDESVKLFEEFLGRYPYSQLKEDCLKALQQLKQEK